MLDRGAKEKQLGQKGHVFWFYGLSGSGKSTLANGLERRLLDAGIVTKILDGDNIRSRLNADLGFSDVDRVENIRRIAEVARLFVEAGIVVLTSFITPTRALRSQASKLVGSEDMTPIFVDASFETCAKRDVKGLYAKASSGKIQNFTGLGSDFESPTESDSDWRVLTDTISESAALDSLYEKVLRLIRKA